MYRHVVNSSRLHLLYCKWSLKLQVPHCTYIRIRIKDLIHTRITSTCIFIKIKCHIKISSRSFISFPLPNDEKILEIWSYDQCLQDIFIIRNLMIHIVCHHYVHMTPVKFLQETDQMISTSHDLVFIVICSSCRLLNITYFSRLIMPLMT